MTLAYGLPFLPESHPLFLFLLFCLFLAPRRKVWKENITFIIALTHLPFPNHFTGDNGESSYYGPYPFLPLHPLGFCPSQALAFSCLDHFSTPTLSWASLVAQMVKRICLHCRKPEFDPWVGKNPSRKEWLPPPVFLPGEFQDGLESMGLQRVEHDWATKSFTFHCHPLLVGLWPSILPYNPLSPLQRG